MHIGIEGSTVSICAKIFNGTTERAISVYLSAIGSTAAGNAFAITFSIQCIASCLIMITEGADFLGVSSVELRMPGYNTINDTVCTNVLVVNDTDIEDQEQFNILLETFDPAVRILLKFGTIIIPVDPYDSKWQFSVFHLTIFIPQLLYLEYQMLQSQ